MSALCRVLSCESGYRANAYAEGYVGWNYERTARVYNRSRGIAQIGDGWGHIATDEQAYSVHWSLLWLAADPDRSTERVYPECGISRR